jgi:hypothetical protein
MPNKKFILASQARSNTLYKNVKKKNVMPTYRPINSVSKKIILEDVMPQPGVTPIEH